MAKKESSDILGSDTILKHIKENKFSPVYYIYGDEPYLKFFYMDELCKRFIGDADLEDAVQKFDGDSLSTEVFEAAVTSFSMFSERKAVIIKDCPLNGDVSEFTVKNPNMFNPDTVVIFYDSKEEYDKKSENAKKFIAFIKETGSLIVINHLDDATLLTWVKKQCHLQNLKVDDNDAKYLISAVGKSMFALKSEIEKIKYYSDDGILKASDVDDLCYNSAEVQAFAVTNAIMKKDYPAAFKAIEDFLSQNKDGENIIAATVFNQICRLWKVKFLYDGGKSESEIAAAIGQRSVHYTLINFAKTHKQENTDRMIELCVKADLALKRANTMPKNTVLYRLIAELIEQI